MKRELFQEAIADAKAVRNAAIINAKAALEESFTPHLQSILSTKIREMEEEDDEPFVDESTTDDEFNLDELLEELDEADDKEDDDKPKPPKKKAEPKKDDDKDEPKDDDKPKKKDNDDELDIEDMTEDQLKTFIEDIITGMVETGELEPGEGGIEGGEDEELGFDVIDDELPSTDMEEIDLDVIDDEDLEEEDKYVEMETQLQEAVSTVKFLKSKLNEINLLNSKLIYTNKIFKARNLTEGEKVKVLGAFDKATTTKEAKLVYETVKSGINKAKRPVKNQVRGRASKFIGENLTKRNKPIIETNEMVSRFQKIAGIGKK